MGARETLGRDRVLVAICSVFKKSLFGQFRGNNVQEPTISFMLLQSVLNTSFDTALMQIGKQNMSSNSYDRRRLGEARMKTLVHRLQN